MAEKKVTIMVLKVDLECSKCYKKVKKLLCKYPQIQDQVYDEKANTVIITVVCCSPEKIRDKLCCKGRGFIKSIDIKEPEKKKPDPPKADPEKPKPKPPAADPKPKAPEPAPKAPEPKPKAPEPAPKAPEPKPKAPEPAPKAPEPAPKAPAPAPKAPEPPVGYPPIYPICCVPCYVGLPVGPCNSGHGLPMPVPPCNCSCGGRSMPAPPCNCGCGGRSMPAPPCNCGCGGRSVCHDGYGRGYTVNRCDYYFSEENPTGCTVM